MIETDLLAEDTLELTAHLPLPMESAWRLWTDAGLMARWWGPKEEDGRPVPATEIDWVPEVGRAWTATLTMDRGVVGQSGRFLVVDRPRRLSFTFQWSWPDSPETRVDVELTPVSNGTSVRFRQSGLSSAESRDSHAYGWRLCLERLEAEA